MWRLLNWLFGWQYVVVIARVMDFRYLQRVRRGSSGRLYVDFNTAMYLNNDGTTDSSLYRWEALTWSPNIKNDEQENEGARNE